MDRIPLNKLLEPCSADGGVGQNLEYDSRHISMCEHAEGTPEQEYGETLIAAQAPDWRELYKTSSELSIETRDLRVAVMMSESLCRLQGWIGLDDGLKVVSCWTVNFWDLVHPQLDESDGNDPVERLGILARLSHTDYLIEGVLQLPLAEEPALGSVTLQDLRRSPVASDERLESLTRPEIEAIFLSASTESLRNTGDLIQSCLQSVEQIEAFLNEKLGPGQWNADRLLAALRECADAVENAWGNRVGVVHHEAQAKAGMLPSDRANSLESEGETTSDAQSAATANESGVSLSDLEQPLVITSRAEAMEVLDCLCQYFHKYEPASPVPLLLQRAKRLIPMSFVDILRELAPNGLDQAMQSVGALNEES
jgi:type VI secretion system protein ImpA